MAIVFGNEIYHFRNRIGINFDELRELSNTLEESLESKLIKFKQRVAKKAKKVSLEDLEDFYEYFFFEKGGYQLQESFPELLRKSLFTSCYSNLEVELINLCIFLKEKMKLKLNLRDLSDEGIFKAQTYIKKVVGVEFPDDSSKEWGKILAYNVIRNCIVHNSGQLNVERNSKGVERVRELSNNSSHFEINEKNEIKLNRDFSLEFLKTSELFLDKLYKPISMISLNTSSNYEDTFNYLT